MIPEFFQKTWHHWKVLLKDKAYVYSLVAGIGVLVGGWVISTFASIWHDANIYPNVGDYVLQILPVYDLSFLFVWGYIIIIVSLFIYGIFIEPEIAPFAMKTFGVLMIVRACFISLTFLGPPQEFYYMKTINAEYMRTVASKFFFNNDLFFSGHTAIPFLAFLIFKTWFRWIYLFATFVMAATVLIMHVHYSIDVLAAFFITYGIYAISNRIFKNLNIRFSKRLEVYGWDAVQKLKQKIWK